MGPFERTALDSDTICTICLAYLCWRTAHEGHLPDDVESHCCQLRSLPYLEGLAKARLRGKGVDALLYANFIRILSDIEETTSFSAMRIVRADDLPEPLNIPHVTTTAGTKKEVIGLLPAVSHLEKLARRRCEYRVVRGFPMSHSAAAFANSGWNAIVDERLLFSARNHEPLFRNSYRYIYV
jgi:hypothetical protein